MFKTRKTPEFDKPIQKFIQKTKETRIAKTILKKSKVGGFTLSDLMTQYKATIIKKVWILARGQIY